MSLWLYPWNPTQRRPITAFLLPQSTRLSEALDSAIPCSLLSTSQTLLSACSLSPFWGHKDELTSHCNSPSPVRDSQTVTRAIIRGKQKAKGEQRRRGPTNSWSLGRLHGKGEMPGGPGPVESGLQMNTACGSDIWDRGS